MRRIALPVLLFVLVFQVGCLADAFRQTSRLFHLRPFDDETEFATDATSMEWQEVGKEARSDRPKDNQGDPLYSPRAREIEESLGVTVEKGRWF